MTRGRLTRTPMFAVAFRSVSNRPDGVLDAVGSGASRRRLFQSSLITVM